MSVWHALQRTGQLRAIDHAFALALQRLRPDTVDEVLVAAALASLATSQGHSAFDPAQPHVVVDAPLAWPAAAQWSATLAASPWIDAQPQTISDAQRPLVLERGLLYLRRYREYEQRLADGLRRIAQHSGDAEDPALLQPLFDALFADVTHDDLQAKAAALALRTSLLLITGGPGTGKTSTIARILLLLGAQHRIRYGTAPRIALAAPTGRAAERMAQSLRDHLQRLSGLPQVDAGILAALPTEASTLHRLLGPLGDSPRFRHDAAHPLPLDVLVVDEASMIDLPLMSKLIDAVGQGTRLLLLGDAEQLPSVETGDVLRAMASVFVDSASLIQSDTKMLFADANVPTESSIFVDCGIRLQRTYRQTQDLDLSALAEAVRIGDADAVVALLRSGDLRGVYYHSEADDLLQATLREEFLQPWRALRDCSDPAQALLFASQQRALTPVRGGAQGVHALNARIEEALAGVRRTTYFHGRLLQVTQNSPRQGLFNGDTGVCLDDGVGRMLAWFGGDEPRAFPPAGLPSHESAFVTTVHKAQGSEFDRVFLVLPRHPSRVSTRAALYTALTRARARIDICASETAIRQAIAATDPRISGLLARLN